jgi:predicted O-methyltransferase YrrM
VPPLATKALRPGGLLISDNMIWSGRVTEPNPDETTRGILEMTRMLRSSSEFATMLIPLRDGVTVSVKR